MIKENQSNDWKVVSQAEVAKATKTRSVKKLKSIAAVEALKKLKPGEAVCIELPKDRYKADALRCWWRTKMQKVSYLEQIQQAQNDQTQIHKAFVSVTSSDGKHLFIQRNPKSKDKQNDAN